MSAQTQEWARRREIALAQQSAYLAACDAGSFKQPNYRCMLVSRGY